MRAVWCSDRMHTSCQTCVADEGTRFPAVPYGRVLTAKHCLAAAAGATACYAVIHHVTPPAIPGRQAQEAARLMKCRVG